MENITLEDKSIRELVNHGVISELEGKAASANNALEEKNSSGSEYVGWLNFPMQISEMVLKKNTDLANNIRSNCEAFVVIGIGGSYLGSRAVIEALKPTNFNLLPKEKRGGPEIYFAGHNLDGRYFDDLLDLLKDKEVIVNIISKSGTTTEPAVAFRIFKQFLGKKYSAAELKKRIIVTTDSSKGILRELAEKEGYPTFEIPDNIGGRYSVFTPVGLLPIAVAGLSIEDLLNGARDGIKEYSNNNIEENPACQYAIDRNVLYQQGKKIEILASYCSRLQCLSEWWKQLFGESEGKDNKGIFPSSAIFTTDLHSMGQYIQQGERQLFETVINIENDGSQTKIEKDNEDTDGLNYLSGKKVMEVSKKALEAVVIAHENGGVPNIRINVPQLNPYYIGKLLYFFEKACAISAIILGVNPFDQPGVEDYKKEMFKLLGKPGF